MSNHTSQGTLLVEDDSIRTWAAAIILLEVVQDGELQVRTGDGEIKALVVTEGVGIVTGALCLSSLEEFEALGDGSGHGALEVADVTAGRGTGLGLAFAQERVYRGGECSSSWRVGRLEFRWGE